jgi:hypothetical protein
VSRETLVEVYRAHGEMEGLVIKSLLESYGIPSLLKSDAAPSVLYFAVDGMGEFKVMVREDMADEARRLIEDREDV